MNNPIISLQSVQYTQPKSGRSFSLVIDCLDLEKGKIHSLVGPNGAGKSMLLLVLALMLKPDKGTIIFEGKNPWQDKMTFFEARRRTTMVSHQPYLFKGSVVDNLILPLKLRNIPENEWPERLDSALSLAELQSMTNKSVLSLSAGEIQRVAIARALVVKPDVLLLDEPTANIDAGLALRIEAGLQTVNRTAGTTIVFSTHNFAQASRLSDEIFYLSEGRKVNFSHENCFRGEARSDSHSSWLEPFPSLKIVLPEKNNGYVTCFINPEEIEIITEDDPLSFSELNVFSGRVTRLEINNHNKAVVRVSGRLTFRAVVPIDEVEKKKIYLSREVKVKFSQHAVKIMKADFKEKDND